MSTLNKLTLTKTHDYCGTREPKLTVVLIHGIAADSSDFTHLLQYLEGVTSLKSVRFVTFDLLGSGKSVRDDNLNYDYKEQLEALHNSIEALKIKTPLVLVGHSMGTFIAVRYANTYKKAVQELVLLSPPVYTEDNLADPAFKVAIKMFEEAVSAKNPKILQEKAFQNSIEKIVMDKKNYQNLIDLKIPAVLIYGDKDRFIGSFNYAGLLSANSKYLTTIKTDGRHGIIRDKYTGVERALEGILYA